MLKFWHKAPFHFGLKFPFYFHSAQAQSLPVSNLSFCLNECKTEWKRGRIVNMPSSRQYLDFVLDQLSEAEGISHRAMMGEYIIYCRGKVIGGIYDNRFLVKPAKSAQSLMPNAPREKWMKGKGASDIRILHIGIVKGVMIEIGRASCRERV